MWVESQKGLAAHARKYYSMLNLVKDAHPRFLQNAFVANKILEKISFCLRFVL